MVSPISYRLVRVCALMLVGVAFLLPGAASADYVAHGSWEVHQDEHTPYATDIHFTIYQKERNIWINDYEITVTIVDPCPGATPFAESTFTPHDNGQGDGRTHAIDCVFRLGEIPFCCEVRIDATLYLSRRNTVRIKDIVWTYEDAEETDDDLPDNGWDACKPTYDDDLIFKFYNDGEVSLTITDMQFYINGEGYLGNDDLALWADWDFTYDGPFEVAAQGSLSVDIPGFEFGAWLYLRGNIIGQQGGLEFRGEHESREPTYVDLASFNAMGRDGFVEVQWITANEIDNAGFNVHRSLTQDGERVKLSNALMPAQGDELTGGIYSYTDRAVRAGLTYYYWLEDVDIHGMANWHGPVSAQVIGTDSRLTRFDLAPNPFKGTTEIHYGLAAACEVNLTVYDPMGREVRTLVAEHQPSGFKTVNWDGRNDAGQEVPGGLYFYRLTAGGLMETKTIVYLK